MYKNRPKVYNIQFAGKIPREIQDVEKPTPSDGTKKSRRSSNHRPIIRSPRRGSGNLAGLPSQNTPGNSKGKEPYFHERCKHLTLLELFPDRKQLDNTPVHIKEDDLNLTYAKIVEFLSQVFMTLSQPTFSNNLGNSFRNSVEFTTLFQRRDDLLYYKAISERRLSQWQQYEHARSLFHVHRENGLDEGDDTINAIRFDEEYRRWLEREKKRNGAKLDTALISAVENTDASTTAKEILDAIQSSAKRSWSSKKLEKEYTKLKEEIEHWKERCIADVYGWESILGEEYELDATDSVRVVIENEMDENMDLDQVTFVTTPLTSEEEYEKFDSFRESLQHSWSVSHGNSFHIPQAVSPGASMDVNMSTIQSPPESIDVSLNKSKTVFSSADVVFKSWNAQDEHTNFEEEDSVMIGDTTASIELPANSIEEKENQKAGLFKTEFKKAIDERSKHHFVHMINDLRNQIDFANEEMRQNRLLLKKRRPSLEGLSTLDPSSLEENEPSPKNTAIDMGQVLKQSTEHTMDSARDSMRMEESDVKTLRVQIIEQIGSGGHAKVFKATLLDTGDFVAVKRIRSGSPNIHKLVKMEARLWRQLSHPHVVKYMGCLYSRRKKEYNIVLEYACGGPLDKVKGALPETMVSQIMRQALEGLNYLHSKKIIHRDVKPANMLLTNHGFLKICDFGVSAQLMSLENLRCSTVGTPNYLAPEVIMVEPYREQIDIWSLGCSALELLSGEKPYPKQNAFNTMYRMVEDEHPPIPNGLELSENALDFLHQCWKRNWRERPSTILLLNHPFVSKTIEPIVLPNK